MKVREYETIVFQNSKENGKVLIRVFLNEEWNAEAKFLINMYEDTRTTIIETPRKHLRLVLWTLRG